MAAEYKIVKGEGLGKQVGPYDWTTDFNKAVIGDKCYFRGGEREVESGEAFLSRLVPHRDYQKIQELVLLAIKTGPKGEKTAMISNTILDNSKSQNRPAVNMHSVVVGLGEGEGMSLGGGVSFTVKAINPETGTVTIDIKKIEKQK